MPTKSTKHLHVVTNRIIKHCKHRLNIFKTSLILGCLIMFAPALVPMPGATRGAIPGTAIPGAAGGGTAGTAMAAAGLGGAAAQCQRSGGDPPRAVGGAADAHSPAIKWSSCGETGGWEGCDCWIMLESLEVGLMLVQVKIIKTVARQWQGNRHAVHAEFREFHGL